MSFSVSAEYKLSNAANNNTTHAVEQTENRIENALLSFCCFLSKG